MYCTHTIWGRAVICEPWIVIRHRELEARAENHEHLDLMPMCRSALPARTLSRCGILHEHERCRAAEGGRAVGRRRDSRIDTGSRDVIHCDKACRSERCLTCSVGRIKLDLVRFYTLCEIACRQYALSLLRRCESDAIRQYPTEAGSRVLSEALRGSFQH